jgi:hypothetical protein
MKYTGAHENNVTALGYQHRAAGGPRRDDNRLLGVA